VGKHVTIPVVVPENKDAFHLHGRFQDLDRVAKHGYSDGTAKGRG
jgi:hypothetical protein